jgi:hypothetical protein
MADSTPQTQRRIGFAVLIALACVIALAQIVGAKRHDEDGIDKGIRALQAAAVGSRDDREEFLAKAEHQFGTSTGTIVVEPQAIIGLELVERMDGALGTPDPPEPEVATLDERRAAEHAQALMARGKPEAALAYLGRQEVRSHAGRGVAVLARFAERWVALRPVTPK